MIDTERQANQNKRSIVWTFHAGKTLKIYVKKTMLYTIGDGEPPTCTGTFTFLSEASKCAAFSLLAICSEKFI
jgi:hypothetical protein